MGLGEGRKPLWAIREFRWLVIVMVMGIAIVGVLVFEIGPLMETKRQKKLLALPSPDAPVGTEPKPVVFDGQLEKAEDRTPLNDQEIGYTTLMRHLSKMSAEAMSSQARAARYETLVGAPADWRGVTLRITGLYAYSRTVRFTKPIGDLEWVHQAWLTDFSAKEGYIIHFLEPLPAQVENKERRQVLVADAIFLKMVTYQGDKGPVVAPLFLARGARLVKDSVADETFGIGSVVVGVSVVSVLVCLFLTTRIMQRRTVRLNAAPLPPMQKA